MGVPDEFTWWLDRGHGAVDVTDARCVADDLASADRAERVAIIAHFDPSGRASHSTRRLVDELDRRGFTCVLVTSSPVAPSVANAATVLRPNVGYDFGSWATALHLLPHARQHAEVLLTNDSILGPFAPLERATARPADADVWAITSTTQIRPHLQSYWLQFRPGVLASPPLVRFFASIRDYENKVAIVRHHEIGLSESLRRAGLVSRVLAPAGDLGVGRVNPTLAAWRELLRRGFPFVKRSLLRDPRVRVPREEVESAVREILGADAAPYLDGAA